jgi:hypothetical protein
MDQRALDRFWSKVEKTDACWLWHGSRNNMGYPVFFLRTNPRNSPLSYAHRLSFAIAKGPIPDGMVICHKCDVPHCINPGHLFLGTQKDNMADCSRKGRTRCGTRVGESNHKSKLTAQAVREIRAIVNPNISHLAKKYGVSRHPIKLVLTGETWRHVL